MEMVPGILKSQDPTQGPGIFNQCIHLIADDYRWDYEVKNAADFGAAQTRQRLYFWGNRRDQEPMESPLASLLKRPFTPIKDVLSKEVLDLAEQCPADGRSRLSLIGKNGQLIAGAWGSLRPEKRENRTLKMDGLMFTITGTSVRDCLIPYRTALTNAPQNRLLTVLELKLLMGFPFSYFLPGKLHAGVKSKIIASGVDVRFASYLLEHIKKVIGND
jgi:site-specific DNA-cytosine methylase